ncbi:MULTISPECIES: SDR family oxidoreductase [Pseudomonas]|uniref:3-alpha-hydroxysteroid dehydrogenase n=3 Tax=Pseudomonas TaxID=286 RepID=A0A2R7UH31_PSEDL|nr:MULTISPECIES: SDR family oxidoreductase [Pseudomonas]MRF40592.1 SDR family oxidoreductase [Escherichia coli]MBF8644379.1 SDR family oxidoreductase [Pseudomonas pudica]MBF8701338.1 SDR family oxidoreductase [Pseudomonas putida]MBF8707851.1 SDR family oxidoreductase [Pseudomonas putida]MBF8735112.1 SDR family oxidoreductase [Pseudomonas putida]
MSVTAISGSASGIGAAVAAALRAAGNEVIGIDRADAEVVADLSTEQGRAAAIAGVLERSGGVLDGLVCCAGVGVTAPSCGLILAVNYFGVSQLLEGLQGALARGRNPAALVIGSVAATQPGAEQQPMTGAMLEGDETRALDLANDLGQPHLAYACSKYAITHHARSLASGWGQRGMRLNVVAPGAVQTPLHQASLEDARFGKAVREFVAPLGRAGRPEEIAALVTFLQSEQARFVHGSVVFIDGGMDAMVRAPRF